MKMVMEIIEKTEQENRRNQEDVKKLPAYKEAGAKMHRYHDYTGKWEDWQEK